VTIVDSCLQRLRVNRRLTLRFLDYLVLLAATEAKADGTTPREEADRLLAADPGGGTAGSLGWNLMHIAVYEEACCSPLPPKLWERFRHGTAPGCFVAPLREVADRLLATRTALVERVAHWSEADLDGRPDGTTMPEMTRRQLLDSAVWHEPHHLTVCYDILARHFSGG
jgi:hypothetical protein